MLWIALPVVGAIHGAHEQHVYCAEHGALEELRGGSAAGTSDLPESVIDAGAPAPDEHEACAFSHVVPCKAAARPSLTWHRLPPAAQPCVAPVASSDTCPIPLLALAPKSSPPVRS